MAQLSVAMKNTQRHQRIFKEIIKRLDGLTDKQIQVASRMC